MNRGWKIGWALALFCCAGLAFAQDDGGDAGVVGGSDAGTVNSYDVKDPDSDPGEVGGIDATMEVGEGNDWSESSALQGDLAKSLQEMIKQLKAEKYGEFLTQHLDPDELAAALKKKTPEELAQGLADGKAQALIEIISSLRTKIPVYTSDGSTAAFTIDAQGNQIRFRKIQRDGKDVWCLKNR